MPSTAARARNAAANCLPGENVHPRRGGSQSVNTSNIHMGELSPSKNRVRRWGGTVAAMSDWMARESFLEEVMAEQQLWGQSQCPHPPSTPGHPRTRPALVCTPTSPSRTARGLQGVRNLEFHSEVPHGRCHTTSLQLTPSLGDDISMRHMGDTGHSVTSCCLYPLFPVSIFITSLLA